MRVHLPRLPAGRQSNVWTNCHPASSKDVSRHARHRLGLGHRNTGPIGLLDFEISFYGRHNGQAVLCSNNSAETKCKGKGI